MTKERHTSICHKCRKKAVYSSAKNSYYCPDCHEWVNFICDDPGCDECKSKRWLELNKPLYEKMLDIEINKRSGR